MLSAADRPDLLSGFVLPILSSLRKLHEIYMLILTKFIKIDATRYRIMHNIRFCLWLAPDPSMGIYSRPSNPLAGGEGLAALSTKPLYAPGHAVLDTSSSLAITISSRT